MSDARNLTTAEMIAELRRRDEEPPSPIVAVRKLLVDTCNKIGFPRPENSHGLAEWADECLDGLLGRGTQVWTEAHDLVIDALDGALLKDAVIVEALLIRARDITLKHASNKCECEAPMIAKARAGMTPATMPNCMRCNRRVRKA